jgi:hypothetical protein
MIVVHSGIDHGHDHVLRSTLNRPGPVCTDFGQAPGAAEIRITHGWANLPRSGPDARAPALAGNHHAAARSRGRHRRGRPGCRPGVVHAAWRIGNAGDIAGNARLAVLRRESVDEIVRLHVFHVGIPLKVRQNVFDPNGSLVKNQVLELL